MVGTWIYTDSGKTNTFQERECHFTIYEREDGTLWYYDDRSTAAGLKKTYEEGEKEQGGMSDDEEPGLDDADACFSDSFDDEEEEEEEEGRQGALGYYDGVGCAGGSACGAGYYDSEGFFLPAGGGSAAPQYSPSSRPAPAVHRRGGRLPTAGIWVLGFD